MSTTTPAPHQYDIPDPPKGGMSSSAIIGVTIALVIGVFIAVFVFAKCYIRYYENKVTATYRRRADTTLAAEEEGAVVEGNDGHVAMTAVGPPVGNTARQVQPSSAEPDERRRRRDEILNVAQAGSSEPPKAVTQTNAIDLFGIGGFNEVVEEERRQTSSTTRREGGKGAPAFVRKSSKMSAPPLFGSTPHNEGLALAPQAASAAVPQPRAEAASSTEPARGAAYSPAGSTEEDVDAGFHEQQRAAYLEDLGFSPDDTPSRKRPAAQHAHQRQTPPAESVVAAHLQVEAEANRDDRSTFHDADDTDDGEGNVALHGASRGGNAFVSDTTDDLHFEFETA